MTDPPADQPYILWALGVAFVSVCSLVTYIFRAISKAGTDAERIATDVRAELLRAEIRADAKMTMMHEENKARYVEGREDRNAIRQEIRENHDTDLAQHAQMIQAIAELPLKVSEMVRARGVIMGRSPE